VAGTSGTERVDVFVSHAGADRSWAEWVDWILRMELGRSTICDVYDFSVGDDFVLKMNEALARAEHVMLLLSPQSLGRKYVEAEWSAAFASHGSRLLPVVVEPVEVPPLLAPIVRVDVTGSDRDEALRELREALEGVGRPGEEPAFPGAAARAVATAAQEPGFPNRPVVFCDRIPHRNPWFTGREDILDELRARFGSGATAALTQTIAGLGGVGKTALAVEHCYRMAGPAEIVWWVHAERADSAAADLADLAGHLGVAVQGRSIEEQVCAVRACLEATLRPWLVVFDNIEDPASIESLRPRRGNGQVVSTTRSQLGAGTERVKVEVFDTEVASTFLRTRLSGMGRDAAHQLAVRLGGHALALEQAAGYLADTGATVDEYLATLEWAGLGALDEFAEDTASTTTAVLRTSLARVDAGEPDARRLLEVLAFVAPDDIPVDLGVAILKELRVHSRLDRVVVTSRRLSLLDREGDALRMHRLTQELARAELGDTDRSARRSTAINAVASLWPEDPQSPPAWPACARLFPHAVAAAENVSTLQAARLRWRLSIYLGAFGDYQRAATMAEEVLAYYEQARGVDHPETIRARHLLSVRYSEAGNYQRALALAKQVLTDRERVLGADHRHTNSARYNLSIRYSEVGDVEHALPLAEQVLTEREQLLGSDHPDTIAARYQLSIRYSEVGEYQRALTLAEQVLTERERLLGADHRDTISAREILSARCGEVGDHERALTLAEQVLTDRERVLGPDQPDTIAARYQLSVRYSEVGDDQRALTLAKQAHTEYERVLGSEHPDTIRARNWLTRM
jgi:tetratricopeptide (TPR) repeat protein